MKNGFTLIELLVATSIMLVILGGGIASYITFNEKQKLIGSARDLQLMLRSAQVKARAGERPEGCDKLLAYTVEGLADGSTVQLYAQCQQTSGAFSEISIQTNDFETGITLDSSLNVEYKTLHGGVTGFGSVQLNSSFDQTYTFVIDDGGAINAGALI